MKTQRLVFSLADEDRLMRVQHVGEIAHVPADVEGLSFERVAISDEDLRQLSRLRRLRCLDLDGTRVTDVSLEWVSTLSELEELWLEGTGVTDAGIQMLRKNKKLRFLSVAYTMVTPAGAEALQAHCDGLEVSS